MYYVYKTPNNKFALPALGRDFNSHITSGDYDTTGNNGEACILLLLCAMIKSVVKSFNLPIEGCSSGRFHHVQAGVVGTSVLGA